MNLDYTVMHAVYALDICLMQQCNNASILSLCYVFYWFVFIQVVNGTAAHYNYREKNNDAATWGPLRSEKEALLLGNYFDSA